MDTSSWKENVFVIRVVEGCPDDLLPSEFSMFTEIEGKVYREPGKVDSDARAFLQEVLKSSVVAKFLDIRTEDGLFKIQGHYAGEEKPFAFSFKIFRAILSIT